MNEKPQSTQTDRQQAEKLLTEGWLPYPFTIGALCRKGVDRPSVTVAPALWQAMRELLENRLR